MVGRIRRVCQHLFFFLLLYGGRAGISLGSSLPCFSCPVVKAMTGQLALEAQAFDMVIPTTCDWMVQFSRMADIRENSRLFWMELPRLRDNERASQRWLAEIKHLKTWLEESCGRTISPSTLVTSIRQYARADDLCSLERVLPGCTAYRDQYVITAMVSIQNNFFEIL